MNPQPDGRDTAPRKSFWSRFRLAGAGVLTVCFAAGIVFWGGFNTAMEATNEEAFCISCHEMEANVFTEYRNTVHYTNRSGVRATCPDCHVPKDWTFKVMRKIQASKELWHHFLGTVDTPEKFDAKRLQLAQNEWARLKANDSRECRNCHDYTYFDYAEQRSRSARMHQTGFEEGKTCIDCHKGIAHRLPAVDQDIGLTPDKAAGDAQFHGTTPQQ